MQRWTVTSSYMMQKKNISPNSDRSRSQDNTSRPQLATKSRNYILYETNFIPNKFILMFLFCFFLNLFRLKKRNLTFSYFANTTDIFKEKNTEDNFA